MKNRRSVIAISTALVLTVALPTLGRAVGIYSLRWTVGAHAYATVSGACGHVSNPRPLAFCFGESIEVRYGPESPNSIARMHLWVHDLTTGETWRGHPPDVKFSVDPLLGSATVRSDDIGCGGPIDLRLRAVAEPNLRVRPYVVPPQFNDLGLDEGHVEIFASGSASLGRDAKVNGSMCGGSIVGRPSSGRILRGVGSEGVLVHVRYA